ncbi:amidohydrolase family protein [Kordiimonas sp. SCSIO 12610]|uniref:amidohydrolase family protein n=1 Tax=Kordiimonas sp. SCSIO 12610 TaxID=2829597 RepID=UPI00210AE888|nr:amidohydrolase family protein [Kordiimonas sp. SCSIO 12610]UTW56290.1 amidohydrolase family protein [Kordiimonas sp. SCSIO 12610]
MGKTAVIAGMMLGVSMAGTLSAVAQKQFAPNQQQFVSVNERAVYLTNVRLVDGTGSPAKENQTLLIEGGKIKALGSDIKIPSGAKTVDLSGKTVLPGMVGLHEHIFYNASEPDQFIQSSQPIIFPRLYLAAGVTTARTAGSFEPYTDVKIKQYIQNGRLIGPNFDTTAPFLEGAPAQFLQAPETETAEEARTFVNYWADQGMTSYKAYMNIKADTLKASIDAAHARGLKVAGHLCSITYRDASNMGIDNLEHGFLLATDFVKNKKKDECPGFPLARFMELELESPEVQDLMDTLIKNKTAITSTLAVLARISATVNPPNPDAVEALGHGAKAHYLGNHANGYARALDNDIWERAVRKEMAWEKAFADKGGLVVAGSDTTGIGGTVAGFANHEQLILLVEAGFSPLEAIKVATLNGAISLDRADTIGSVEVGKNADLIVIDGRPDENISDIKKVETVFKDGIGYNSKAMIASAKGRVEN